MTQSPVYDSWNAIATKHRFLPYGTYHSAYGNDHILIDYYNRTLKDVLYRSLDPLFNEINLIGIIYDYVKLTLNELSKLDNITKFYHFYSDIFIYTKVTENDRKNILKLKREIDSHKYRQLEFGNLWNVFKEYCRVLSKSRRHFGQRLHDEWKVWFEVKRSNWLQGKEVYDDPPPEPLPPPPPDLAWVTKAFKKYFNLQ